MKLVREYINEKFVEDSDPIHDMGIGIYTERTFKTAEEYCNWLLDYLPVIIKTNTIPENIINEESKFIRETYFLIIQNYTKTYITFSNLSEIAHWPEYLNSILYKKGFERAEDFPG
jgi:hypothetical protein